MLALGFSWSAVHAGMVAISLLGTAIVWVLSHIHRRLKKLENKQDDRENAIFGNDDNPLQVGIVKEVSELKQEIESIRRDIDDASTERDELHQRLGDAENKLNNILDELEDN